MALKNDFEATSDISSPFIDEVANPGSTGKALADKARKTAAALDAAFARKPTPSAQISAADREARITDAQRTAQARVDLAERKHGDVKGNKNRAKAEGR